MKVSPSAMIFKIVREADSFIILYSFFFILYYFSGGARKVKDHKPLLPPPRFTLTGMYRACSMLRALP